MVKLFGPIVVFTQTLPKAVNAVVVMEGPAGPPQRNTGLALFLGAGTSMVKSAPLLFVSVQPLLFLKPAVVVVKAGVVAVSEQLAVP